MKIRISEVVDEVFYDNYPLEWEEHTVRGGILDAIKPLQLEKIIHAEYDKPRGQVRLELAFYLMKDYEVYRLLNEIEGEALVLGLSANAARELRRIVEDRLTK